jgi:uncharacterized membrane protein YhaH (DUF805 family)
MSFTQLLFSFSGRINRAKWWLAVLVLFLLQIVIMGLTMVVPSEGFITVLNWAYFILSLWISLAAGTKRLHDLNRTGAWLVLFMGAPFVLLIVSFVAAGLSIDSTTFSGETLDFSQLMRLGGFALIIFAIWLALAIWALVWFGCLRGTIGPNDYGPDPLQPAGYEPMQA